MLDKKVVVPPKAQIGVDPDLDAEHYEISPGGVTVLAKAQRVQL